ncbi:MAG TPA: 23S rRNA (uracil(1939)-C(5))-methyltransferase RlmD [Polyangia bacterium]
MRKGDPVTLKCSGLDEDGAAVGELDGIRVHLAGALPDETARGRIVHLSPHRPEAWATLEPGGIEQASPLRVQPVCPGFGLCGGCVMQHLAYPAQVAWKGERVLAQARSAGLEVPVAACVPSPRPLGYRNRSKLVYATGAGGRPVLGAYAPRSHQVIDLAGCRVAEPPLDDVARALLEILARDQVSAYDERLASGTLRYAVLRVNHLGEVLATLVTATEEWPDGHQIAEELLASRAEVIGVVQNINPSRGNALFGARSVPLAGRATLDDQIGAVRVRLSPTAFFQVNREVAARLYADVLDAARLDGTERVVDCYTGVGGVALTLAARAAEVIGIEENPRAIEDAIASAELNHTGRTRFVCGDAAARLAELDGADVIVLNPPRRGCDQAVLAEVARLKPRQVLYVSCSPETLVRDLGRLAALGLKVRSLQPYDMLPQTPHVEILATLG